MFECFVRSPHLYVCQSLHTLKTTYLHVDVGFHLNFGLGWEGGLLFYNFLGNGAWAWFSLEFLGVKFYKSYFFLLSFYFFKTF